MSIMTLSVIISQEIYYTCKSPIITLKNNFIKIMKKIKIFAFITLLGLGGVKATPVAISVAQKVAQNFYAAKYASAQSFSLSYTENDANGVPVFYVFNVNSNKGFVIVTAEDAAHPIIGYSDEGPFVNPAGTNNNVDYWLQERKGEVVAMRAHNIIATTDIANEWTSYSSNIRTARPTHSVSTTKDSVLPLVKTYWDQSPWYNAYCPGGSVTGCVATAMAQIMRYWSYPSVGLGSYCYYDQVAYGYSQNYGQLCAEFDTSHYVWSAMPSSVGKTNNQVAKLMYDCGVSVGMDYSPTGSGANVLGGAPSAENSYVQYFGYDPNTINGAMYRSYTETNWIALLENELNNKRPMQFQGFDASQGGHSWVCDGYSATNEMHMNWGWSGYNDGYYLVTTMNPSPFDFALQVGVIYGIKPSGPLAVQQITENTTVAVYPNPSHGVFNFTTPNGNNQVKIYNVLGQEVSSSFITTGKGQINLSSQPKGIYLYRVMSVNGEQISTGRLVVE